MIRHLRDRNLNWKVSWKAGLAAALAAAVCLALLAPVPAFGVAPAGAWPAGEAHWNSEGRGVNWVGALAPGLGDLNSELEKRGLPTLAGTGLLFGGGGYGAWENWRVGGFGGGGAIASQKGLKRTELSMGFGALQVARVWPLGGVQLELGALVGGGGATLILSEGEPASSADAYDNRYDTVVDRGFFLVGPSVGARIDLTPYIGLQLSAGYVYTMGSWEHRGSKAKLDGLPNLNGTLIQVGITFGGHALRRR